MGGELPLREEAIDLHLRRYGANNPDAYETLFQIEMELFGDRQKEEKKKKDSEKRQSEAKQKAASRGRSGKSGSYKQPVARPTVRIPKK